jgi:hypothetical protein
VPPGDALFALYGKGGIFIPLFREKRFQSVFLGVFWGFFPRITGKILGYMNRRFLLGGARGRSLRGVALPDRFSPEREGIDTSFERTCV